MTQPRDNGALIKQLRRILRPRAVLTEPADMVPYLSDWRGRKQGKAACVVLPSSTDDVVAIVNVAREARRPIFPQGGNTGLCYGAVPAGDGTGVVLSLERMNRIRRLDKTDNAIIADAGVVLAMIHEAAESIDRSFPLRLGSEGTAQIGGLVSTNAGGTAALRYGVMRDLTFGLEVVLPSGEILDDLEPLSKDNTGYDLKHLFIGAEGTLGIVTGVALRLHPALHTDAHAWAAMSSPSQALVLLEKLRDTFDTALMACEFLSRSQVDLVLKHIPRTRQPFAEAPAWSVMIELGVPNVDEPLRQRLESALMSLIDEGVVEDAVVAQSAQQATDFWHIRHSVSEANKLGGHGLTHDISVRVSAIPAFIAACETLIASRFPNATPVVTCHLGDGNIHYIVMFEHDDWAGLDEPGSLEEAVQAAVHDVAHAHGGTFSAEHGIGRKLTDELKRLAAPARYRTLYTVKRLFDPENLFNPGVLYSDALFVQEPPQLKAATQ